MSIYETKRFRLITKSPIHIGSMEQRITRFEFIHHGQYIWPISEDKLSIFLQSKNLITSYVTAIEKEGNRFNLADFFRNKGINLKEEDLEKISKRKIKILSDAQGIQDLRPLIRDGFGTPYIPGTSIKGVIRTALLYNALKDLKEHNPSRFHQEIENKISADIDADHGRKNKTKFFEWANKKWFKDFILLGKRGSPNTDWLRMIHISDAYSQNKMETILIPVNILKKEKDWTYKQEPSGRPTTIWIECIPENTVFEFEAAWDKNLLEDFKRNNRDLHLPENLDGILSNINSWARDIFNFEKNLLRGHPLENWYRNNVSNFRIGFGSGMLSTTIVVLVSEDLRKKIRNYAGLNRGNDTAPKSRRVWLRSGIPIPLGWAVLEVVDGL